MKQNISVTRARTHKLKIRLTGPDGQPYVMTSGEKLIFGVKKALTDSDYAISKIIEYQTGFEKVKSQTTAPTWKANTYYSKTTSGGVDTYTLTTSQPSNWDNNYTNYYVNNGLYSVELVPSDTQSMSVGTYYYDVGLQRGVEYYSIINTSKFELVWNVTKKQEVVV